MRSAKWFTSGIVEPPKPRLTTGRSGKASAVCHRRIEELPTKRMQSLGAAFFASDFSKAAISFSKRAGPVGSFDNKAEFVSQQKTQKRMKQRRLRRFLMLRDRGFMVDV